jgi:hypothetical protein
MNEVDSKLKLFLGDICCEFKLLAITQIVCNIMCVQVRS